MFSSLLAAGASNNMTLRNSQPYNENSGSDASQKIVNIQKYNAKAGSGNKVQASSEKVSSTNAGNTAAQSASKYMSEEFKRDQAIINTVVKVTTKSLSKVVEDTYKKSNSKIIYY